MKQAASAPKLFTVTTVIQLGMKRPGHACCCAEEDQTRLKAGPCVKFDGLEDFVRLRAKLDGCLTGCRLAKDRAAESLTKVMTREALDYPV